MSSKLHCSDTGASGRFRATRLRGVLPLFLLLLAPARSLAERVEDVPNPKERDNTWVTDMPGALQDDAKNRLNELINRVEAETTAEIAVVVVASLDGDTIEDFANRLFNLWGIGKRESDNGLLFLWSVGDRRVRIEVGDGLTDLIPDSRAGSVLDRYVIPRFKEGNFDEGVVAGVGALAGLLRDDPVELPPEAVRVYEDDTASDSATPDPRLDGFSPFGWVVSAIAALAASIGGLFGFRRWRRNRPRKCPSCSTMMARLSETADDAELERPQRLEERLKSVDYDVWRCLSCRHQFTLRYPKWFAKHSKCPQCRYKTRLKTERTVRSATRHSEGLARVTEDCLFCTYHRVYDRTLPRISPPSSSSGSSSFGSSSSSFGGGGSSGGGSSRGY